MPTYFDVAIPSDSSGDTFATNMIRCTVCGVLIRNVQASRDMHAAWHESMPKGASSGMLTNPAVVNPGATADIVVPLTRTMPNATYTAAPVLLSASPTLLGIVTLVGVVAQTTTTATIRVKNGGLSQLSAGAIAVGVIAVG